METVKATHTHTHLETTEESRERGCIGYCAKADCESCMKAYEASWLQPITPAQEAWDRVLRDDERDAIISSERVVLQAPPLIVVTGPSIYSESIPRSDREEVELKATHTTTHLQCRSERRKGIRVRLNREVNGVDEDLKILGKSDKEIESMVMRVDAIDRADEEEYDKITDIVGSIPLLETPELAGVRDVDDNKFRLNNQRVLVTYAKSNLKKKALKEFFCSKSKKPTLPCKVKIARETHKDGTKHMHVLVDFGYRFQSTSWRIFDFEGRHPNIKPILNPIHWVNCLCYLGKEDKSCTPHPNVVAAAKAWNCKDGGEAWLSGACLKPSDSLALFSMKPSKAASAYIPEPTAQWYHETLLPILSKSTYRDWHWFCDFVGNTQKSWACHHVFSKYCSGEDQSCLVLDLDCSLDSLCNVLAKEQERGWTGDAILVDLPRSYNDEKQFYTNLEKIGNAFGTSAKYNGSFFCLSKRPQVIVFANWWPMLYDKSGAPTASADRWKFYYIERSLTAVCMNLNEVTAARRTDDDTRRVQTVAKAIINKRVAEEKADEIQPISVSHGATHTKYRRT